MAPSAPNLKPGQAKDKMAGGLAFLQEELPLIRRALLTLGATLAVSATLVGTSQLALSQARDTMNQALAQRSAAIGRNAQAETDKREALDYQAKFVQLRQQGFVGEEQRLDWTEQIRRIRDNLQLLPITYEIAAQRPVAIAAEGVTTGDYELRSSRMTLKMELLHEMDLLNFLDVLKRQGRYATQSCTVERDRAANIPGPLSPRLLAECELVWLTLGEPANPAATGQ